MKKVLSLILAVAMLASFAMVASAANVMEFEFWTMDADFGDATEFNAGDVFYIGVAASPATDRFGVEMDFDTNYFEVAQYNGGDDFDMSPYVGSIVLNPEGRTNRLAFGGMQSGNRLKALDGFIGIQIKENIPTGEYTFGTNFAEQAKNMPNGMTAELVETVTIKVNGTSAPAVDTAVTFDTTGVKGFVANAVTTAVNGEVTIDVTPAYGSKIASVVTTDGEALYTANGGRITISNLTAETATVTITTAEDEDLGVATFAATYVDGDTAYVFGKVPAASTAFGIDLDGEKYAAEAATAEGVFGVAFIGLEAGSYTATAYAGEILAAEAATIVIAE